jgi:hypothetical protein
VRRGRSGGAYSIAGLSNFIKGKSCNLGAPWEADLMNTGLTADVMYRDSLLNELRQVELAVTNGERRLAEQERLLVSLKRQKEDLGQAQAALEILRENQRRNEQDRQRLLSLLQR